MNWSADDCFHLDLGTVLQIHARVLEAFGGGHGIRDQALLESAVAAPQASFGGSSVYADSIDIGAAHLFFLCRNHPFVDGNKRVALASCLVFLRLNGMTTLPDSQVWEDLVFDVDASRLDRAQTADRLRALIT